MEILVVSKQTRAMIRKSAALAKKIGALVDAETGKRTGIDSARIEDFSGDFVVTVGGDGTFLWAASKTSLPIFPIRAEGVGFLCSADYGEAFERAGDLLAGNLVETTFPRIRIGRVSGVNEVVITRRLKSKIMRAHISMSGSGFMYKGDGFSVSTILGSTAYNQSLGGPVVSEKMLMVFTPMAPFMRVNPMVFRGRLRFALEREGGVAIIDGNRTMDIEKDVEYEIRLSGKISILGFKPLNHFDKYIQSLNR